MTSLNHGHGDDNIHETRWEIMLVDNTSAIHRFACDTIAAEVWEEDADAAPPQPFHGISTPVRRIHRKKVHVVEAKDISHDGESLQSANKHVKCCIKQNATPGRKCKQNFVGKAADVNTTKMLKRKGSKAANHVNTTKLRRKGSKAVDHVNTTKMLKEWISNFSNPYIQWSDRQIAADLIGIDVARVTGFCNNYRKTARIRKRKI
jgi:hypothetical protein